MDDDAIRAAAGLVGRSGAKEFQVGYTGGDEDDSPCADCAIVKDAHGYGLPEWVPPHEFRPEPIRWFAHAQYRGSRITVEDQAGPVEAVEALARRILDGAECRCGRLVALSDDGAMIYPGSVRPDGTVMTDERVAELTRRGQCRWTREGSHWVGACGAGKQPSTRTGPNREDRRRLSRLRRRK